MSVARSGSRAAGRIGTGGHVALRVEPDVGHHAPAPLRGRLKRRCVRMLRALGLCDVELSVLLAGDERVAELNRAWRRKRGPTDVLSFPAVEDPAVLERWHRPRRAPGAGPERALGDLVISLDTVAQRSPSPAAFEDDLTDLLAHGLLHLLGHDHPTAAERDAMLALQADLVAVASGRGTVAPVPAP